MDEAIYHCHVMTIIISSANEVMFWSLFVCFFVCMLAKKGKGLPILDTERWARS